MAADNKTPNPNAVKFSEAMGAIEKETILKINDVSFEYAVDTFEAVKLFGKHLIEIADNMRADYEKKNAASDTAPAENVVNDHQSEV
ncbi:MAG: hypothetical protein IK122_02645 [Alphaproteobacteria bacterium]|nr:hypothetical protein [Alphaproteobacteria bacterium]